MTAPSPRAAGAALLLAAAAFGCSRAKSKPPAGPPTISLTSPAFASHGALPAAYTCDGPGVSPPLAWSQLPPGTKSLALVVDDPDAPDPKAPKGTWVHWVLYDIPPTATGLPEGIAAGSLPAGTRPGKNDWGREGYGAACPPVGRHRYVHELYALDVVLPDLHSPGQADLEKAMQGHVLARGELVGTYQRQP